MADIARFVRFQDEKLRKILLEKEEKLNQLREMQSQINAIAKDGEKLAMQIQKIKDKAIPMMEKAIKGIEMGEWDDVSQFEVEGNDIVVTIIDLVEQHKEMIRQKRAEEAAKNA